MGVDVAKVYIEAEDKTNAAWQSAGKNVEAFVQKLVVARAGIAGIASVIASAGGLAAITAETIRAREEMGNLSESTGLTVEKLSQIKPVAEAAGKSLSDVTDAVVKFDKAVEEARANPQGQQADLFKKLGIDISTARSADDILDQTVKKFGDYSASIAKTAGAQLLFSRNGAAALPVLKAMNDAGVQAVQVTSAQAEESTRAATNVRAIGVAFHDAHEAIGGEFVPAVSAVTEVLLEFMKQSEATQGSVRTFLGLPLRNWAAIAAISLATLADTARITYATFNLIVAGGIAVGQKLLALSQYAAAAAVVLGGGQWSDAVKLFQMGSDNMSDSVVAMKTAWADFREALDSPTILSSTVQKLGDAEARVSGLTAALEKGKVAFPGLQAAGAASMKSMMSLLNAQIELQKTQRDAALNLQLDLVHRQLQAEEAYHAASLDSEQDYIDTKFNLVQKEANLEVQLAKSTLTKSTQELNAAKSLTPKTDQERAEQTAKIAQETVKVVTATQQLTIAQRNAADVEKLRNQAQVAADVAHMNAMQQIASQETAYLEDLMHQTQQLDFQNSLIGKGVLAQQQANAENQLSLQYDAKRKEVIAQVVDLLEKQPVGYQQQVKELLDGLARLKDQTGKTADEIKQKLAAGAEKQWFSDLSKGISDALVDGGADAGPKIRKAIEDAFKNPIKIALAGAMQNLLSDGLKAFNDIFGTALNPNLLQGPVGVAAGFGGAFGSFAAGALGAGSRGQSLAGNLGMAGAGIGMYAGGPIGAVIGAVVGTVAGYFSDPHGLANRQAQFGTNPSGNYSFSGRDAFGTFGTFNDQWFSQDDMGQQMQQFITALSQTENQLSSLLKPGELSQVQSALATPHDYSFGTEHGDFSGTLLEITRDRLSTMIDTVMPGFGALIRASQGTAEDLTNMAQSLLELRDVGKSITDMITSISGTASDQIKTTIDQLNTKVASAQQDLDAAFNSNDPTKMLAAEQTLTQAVVDRYNTEINMVQQLQASIRQLSEDAYQFQENIAQRIASVGGTDNSASIALNRAGVLRGNIGGTEATTDQISDLQGYVSAIDTWYQQRRSAIESDIQAQQQANQAIAQAQQAAAQARLQGLQDELQLANAFQSVVDRAQQMIDDMRLSAANPLSQLGRLALSQDDVQSLKAKYLSSTGQDRVDAANKLLDALQTEQSMGQDAYQRPSPEYQALYNQVITDIGGVQADAKTFAQQAVDLNRQILDVQNQMQGYQASTATSSASSSAALDALNSEALGYYTWAQQQGDALYKQQNDAYTAQLNAITGGTDVQLFIAQQQAAAVSLLQSIDARIAAWLGQSANPVTNPTPPPSSSFNTNGSGKTPGTTVTNGIPLPYPAPTNTNGSGGNSSATNGNGKSMTININANMSDAQILDVVKKALPTIKRAYA